MRKLIFAGVGFLALSSGILFAAEQPESLLPPGFDDPAPAPSPSSSPQRGNSGSQDRGTNNAPRVAPRIDYERGATVFGDTPPSVRKPATGGGVSTSGAGQNSYSAISGADSESIASRPAIALPSNLPSISELESLDVDELDKLLGLKPKYDIPPSAQRSMDFAGLLDMNEGGIVNNSLMGQPASIVKAALGGTKMRLVSRWGHILLRRALISRLAPPEGMAPEEFAGLRVGALNRLGEFNLARSLAQEIDTGYWGPLLIKEGVEASIGSTDILGACPIVQLQGAKFEDPQWQMLRGICYSFAGQGAQAKQILRKVSSKGEVEQIDSLLAQRYAGVADGGAKQAVNLEWGSVDELTNWRYSMALSLGSELPDSLLAERTRYMMRISALAPMLPAAKRVEGAEIAASEGILSSRALVDVYSQLYADGANDATFGKLAQQLRTSYVAAAPADRMDAIRALTLGYDQNYARMVLAAYAAARLPVSDEFAGDVDTLVTAMLAAGLDQNAMAWAQVAPQGGIAWGQLVLVQEFRKTPVTEGQINSFMSNDPSDSYRKSQFLLAGLAGLGRISPADKTAIAGELEVDLTTKTRWSDLIEKAAATNNIALVTFLAGVGMQGNSWDKMTPRHLYHIVHALNTVGLDGEARMIAAEAVARG